MTATVVLGLGNFVHADDGLGVHQFPGSDRPRADREERRRHAARYASRARARTGSSRLTGSSPIHTQPRLGPLRRTKGGARSLYACIIRRRCHYYFFIAQSQTDYYYDAMAFVCFACQFVS